jgi:predicted ArsR family transcriptional regulator
MSEVIPQEVKRFLLAHIDSIAQLEALLLLRANPNQRCTCKTIAERLYITQEDAARFLSKLVTRGLIEATGTQPPLFQYRPSNEDFRRIIDLLADVYAKYLIPVTNFIHGKSKRNIQDFADAFKIKKDDD